MPKHKPGQSKRKNSGRRGTERPKPGAASGYAAKQRRPRPERQPKKRTASGLTAKQEKALKRRRTKILAAYKCRWPSDPSTQPKLEPESQRRLDNDLDVTLALEEHKFYTALRSYQQQGETKGFQFPTDKDAELEEGKKEIQAASVAAARGAAAAAAGGDDLRRRTAPTQGGDTTSRGDAAEAATGGSTPAVEPTAEKESSVVKRAGAITPPLPYTVNPWCRYGGGGWNESSGSASEAGVRPIRLRRSAPISREPSSALTPLS